MENKPSIGGEEFKVILNPEEFSKGDILVRQSGARVIVTKVYRYNWWRRVLVYLGYPKVKLFLGVKVKLIDK